MKVASSMKAMVLAGILVTAIVVTGCGGSKKGNGGYSMGPVIPARGYLSLVIQTS